MKEKIKMSLRISNNEFDSEIDSLILSAKEDLKLAGVTDDEKKSLVERAITLYCKANFGLDNPDSIKYADAYQKLKDHMAVSEDYLCISKM